MNYCGHWHESGRGACPRLAVSDAISPGYGHGDGMGATVAESEILELVEGRVGDW